LNGNYTGETPDNTGYTNGAVAATWFVTEANAGGSNVDLLLQWNQGQELPAFVRSQSYLGHYTGGNWNLVQQVLHQAAIPIHIIVVASHHFRLLEY
jgi:hypothetical protein